MSTTTSLSGTLISARESMGLSARALARLSGVSQASISAIEHGREPRWSTLQALCRALPSLDPGPLLGREAELPLPTSVRSWSYLASVQGLRAERMVLDLEGVAGGVRRTQVTLEGLETSVGDLISPHRRIELACAAFMGPARLLRSLAVSVWNSEDGHVQFEDEGVRHEFHLPRSGRDGRLDYRRIEGEAQLPREPSLPRDELDGAPFSVGRGIWLDLPARELVLKLSLSGPNQPDAVRVHAWTPSLTAVPGAERPAWQHLHPDTPQLLRPQEEADERTLEIAVRHPAPGLAYGLDWSGSALEHDGPIVTPRRGREIARPAAPLKSFATAFRRLRGRAGTSRRELARQLGVAASTITRLDSGELEPSTSTIVGLLQAWPWVSPWALLRPGRATGAQSHEEAWAEQQRQVGAWAESESRSHRVHAAGVHARSLTRGLNAAAPVRLRLGVTQTLQVPGAWELLRVAAHRKRGDEPRVRIVRRGDGPVVHDLLLDGRGVDVERRLRLVTKEPSGEWRIAPSHPTCEVIIELKFTRDTWPGGFELCVIPRCISGFDEPIDISRALPPELTILEEDPERRCVRLRLLKPLLGLRWLLRALDRPGRPTRK